MKTALFLYSSATGNSRILQTAPKIEARLSSSFDVTRKECHSLEELLASVRASAGVFDALVLASGDGTFSAVAGVLSEMENAPILGYINAGTMGDVGRNFGVSKNWKKACDIICKGNAKAVDMCSLGGRPFVYMAAVGAYSDISYIAKRNAKKRWGILSYYGLAIQEAFRTQTISGTIEHGGVVEPFEAPFLMVLNGKRVGGFAVNRRSSMEDGTVELFYAEKGAFNGLLRYVFRGKRLHRVPLAEARITIDGNQPWCFDGEKGEGGDGVLRVQRGALKIYVK